MYLRVRVCFFIWNWICTPLCTPLRVEWTTTILGILIHFNHWAAEGGIRQLKNHIQSEWIIIFCEDSLTTPPVKLSFCGWYLSLVMLGWNSSKLNASLEAWTRHEQKWFASSFLMSDLTVVMGRCNLSDPSKGWLSGFGAENSAAQ